MKTPVSTFILIGFLTIGFQWSNAQNAKEAVQNTKQIVEGKKMLERDMAELKALNIKLNEWQLALAENDPVKGFAIKQELEQIMARELLQSQKKSELAQREIAQSSAEIRSDRREIRRNREDSNYGRYDRNDDEKDMARDHANRRDDKRDRRDDMRDLQEVVDRAKRQQVLAANFKKYTLNLKSDSMILDKTQVGVTLNAFVELLKQDIAATKRELSEDNRERREDRRERRDDREERDEVSSKRKRW